jgi:hypothetical protein
VRKKLETKFFFNVKNSYLWDAKFFLVAAKTFLAYPITLNPASPIVGSSTALTAFITLLLADLTDAAILWNI